MNYELKCVLIFFCLIVNIAASPAPVPASHEPGQAKQNPPGLEWERELLELRSFQSQQPTAADQDNEGLSGFPTNGFDRERQFSNEANSTAGPDVENSQFAEDVEAPVHRATISTVFVQPHSQTSTSENEQEETELLRLADSNREKQDVDKWKYTTKRKGSRGSDDWEEYPEEGDPTTEKPEDRVISSYDALVDSLTIFLGSPERSSKWNALHGHNSNNEVDFGDLSQLRTVRQMGKGANIPQDLVDAVDPEADENLLELMVRIAENPKEWRNVHEAIQRLDRALTTTNRILASSFEKKEIGKRSSPYMQEDDKEFRSRGRKTSKKRLKHLKTRRKGKNRHYSSNHEWASGEENHSREHREKKPKKGRKNKQKSHKHKSKNKNVKQDPVSLTRPFEFNYDTGQKIRHNAPIPNYGKYSLNSISSVIEKPILKNENIPYAYTNFKPKSAPLASEVFNINENKNFERWKVKYDVKTEDYKYPEWPRFRSDFQNLIYRPKPKTINSDHYGKKIHHHHSDDSFKNKMKEIRRWGLLKQNRKNIFDNLSGRNDVSSENWKETNNVEASTTQKDKLVDKAKILATNKWPAPEEPKEKVWQRFTYHRVTSSPSVQQRDAGAQPRHRSAYVAVSVIPTNNTVKPIEKSHTNYGKSLSGSAQNQDSLDDSQNGQTSTLPDLFNQLVHRQPVPQKTKVNSLKTVEEKFSFQDEDRARLRQVMRDGRPSSNKTLF